jgi:4-hydroxy-2-oxoheptanedioate aldolase
MQKARDRVLGACRANGVAFLQMCTAENVIDRIEEGVRVVAGHSEATARKGRAHQKRTLPV